MSFYYDPTELAKATGYTKANIFYLVGTGALKATRVRDGKILFSRTQVKLAMEYTKKHKKGGKP